MGIRGEVAGGPKTLEFSPKRGKMRIRRLRNMHMRQRQPSVQLLHYMPNRERARHHSAVGRDPHKTEHCRPSKTNAFGARETRVPPQPSRVMKR